LLILQKKKGKPSLRGGGKKRRKRFDELHIILRFETTFPEDQRTEREKKEGSRDIKVREGNIRNLLVCGWGGGQALEGGERKEKKGRGLFSTPCKSKLSAPED